MKGDWGFWQQLVLLGRALGSHQCEDSAGNSQAWNGKSERGGITSIRDRTDRMRKAHISGGRETHRNQVDSICKR